MMAVSCCRTPGRFVILCGLLLFFSCSALKAETVEDTPIIATDPNHGRLLYERYGCYACHGYTGETGSGARLNPPRFDQAAFIAYVRNPSGRMLGTGPSAGMPAYATGLSDQDLADILAWLQMLPSFSPPLEEIPLLQR